MKPGYIEKLKEKIEDQKSIQLTKFNIFDSPSRAYMLLKTMFLNFKKQHELQLMQNRVYRINVKKKLHNENVTRVSADILKQYHQFEERDIYKLIKIKSFLASNQREEMHQVIVKQINNLESVSSIFNCYSLLLKQEFLIKEDKGAYANIQMQMSQKIEQIASTSQDFQIITHKILMLPRIKQSILAFISRLYDKCQQVDHFMPLFKIFTSNFPQNPSKEDYKSLIKICLPQTLPILYKAVKMDKTILEIVEEQSKIKLKTMGQNMSSKTEYILNLIIFAIKNQRNIWEEVIRWQQKAFQTPKNLLKSKAETILTQLFGNIDKNFNLIVNIIEKIADLKEHSEIALIFVRQLLAVENKCYLGNKAVRKFLALKIMHYDSAKQYQYSHLIFGSDLSFIEIIIEMLSFENSAFAFYQNVISKDDSSRILKTYLKDLTLRAPTKYIEYFTAMAHTDILMGNSNPVLKTINPLLSYLIEITTPELAISLIRQFQFNPPTKTIINIFRNLMSHQQNLKDLKEIKENLYSLVKIHVVRCLNLVLLMTPLEKISHIFKIHLPFFLKDFLKEDNNKVFVNISEETQNDLRKAFEEFKKK